MDKHAPLKTRLVKMRPKAPWVNQEMLAEKRILRSLESRWRRSKNYNDRTSYKEFKKKYNRLLGEAHVAYLSNMVSENAHDPKSLFRLIDSLRNKKKRSPLPENIPEAVLAEEFSNFFMNNVNLIHRNLELLKPMNEHVPIDQKKYETTLSCFSVVTDDDVMKL